MDSFKETYNFLVGPAGTGKTTMINKLIKENDNIFLTATTHKAKSHIKSNKVQTIHSFLGYKLVCLPGVTKSKFKNSEYIHGSTVIVDEASMLQKDLFDKIIQITEKYSLKWIFVGDHFQLPPVGDNFSVFKLITAENSVVLDKYYRFQGELMVFLHNLRKLRESTPIEIIDYIKNSKCDSVIIEPDYYKWINTFNTDSSDCFAISYRNDIVNRFSNAKREHLFGRNAKEFEVGDRIVAQDIPNHQYLETTIVKIEKVPIVLKGLTAKAWKIYISDTEFFYKISRESLSVHERNKKIFSLALSKHPEKIEELSDEYRKYISTCYPDISYNYAGTVHKSQGSTYHNVYVNIRDILEMHKKGYLSNENFFRTVYTALTRAKEKLILLV